MKLSIRKNEILFFLSISLNYSIHKYCVNSILPLKQDYALQISVEVRVLRKNLFETFGHLQDIDVIKKADWIVAESKGQKLSGDTFKVAISDFYLTNSICRASPTMAKLSKLRS